MPLVISHDARKVSPAHQSQTGEAVVLRKATSSLISAEALRRGLDGQAERKYLSSQRANSPGGSPLCCGPFAL